MATETTQKTRALVIGAGPGGYVAAIRLAQLGVDTVIVERAEMGGTCLNIGCIPSKALIEASKHYEGLHGRLSEMGIEVDGARVDMVKMQSWKGGIVKKLTSGVSELCKRNGARILKGDARFEGPGRVRVSGADGDVVVEYESVIIATGSVPTPIPGFEVDGDAVLSSTEALALTEVPARLLVIGGGYIGLEMGGMFGRLGSHITVVEMLDQLLPGFPKELAQPVGKKLRKMGAEVLLEAKALGWKRVDGGLEVRVRTKKGDERTVEADKILVTVGRRPMTAGLGLEKIGLEPNRRGFIEVDSRMRTQVDGVYAIGDVAGDPMLAHKASKEGEVAAEVIAGHNAEMDVRAIPAVVFTDPEIATVGLSEAQARAAGHEVATGKFPFAANGRALTTGDADGFVRVIAEKATNLVLGVEIVGPHASDLIAEAALALEMAAFTDDVGLTVHAHPTLPEAIMEAMKAVTSEAIHMLNRG